jgi:hypothetical protein
MVNVRDDAKIADETWVHQLARRRKNLAAVKVLLELAAIGYVCARLLAPKSFINLSSMTEQFSVPQVASLRKQSAALWHVWRMSILFRIGARLARWKHSDGNDLVRDGETVYSVFWFLIRLVRVFAILFLQRKPFKPHECGYH